RALLRLIESDGAISFQGDRIDGLDRRAMRPKRRAMQFIEDHEKRPRAWYGGAVGLIHFNGDLNTGLTLRTIHIRDGVAEVRAGATVLADSDADEEERETVLKAAAMRTAIRGGPANKADTPPAPPPGAGRRALLVDHDDSFVHTLGGYLRRCGLAVTTIRAPIDEAAIARLSPDLIVLSPGPGSPADFGCTDTIRLAEAHDLPIFGVCLGLQAIVEACGGTLLQMDTPMHGKPSEVVVQPESALFAGIEGPMSVGRYHSLAADPATLPAVLTATAHTEDGTVMAVEHAKQPMMAVQFHPESIMSLGGGVGMKIIDNAVRTLLVRPARRQYTAA
ncbi:MAG: chorismate-binding protein, partial [Pseudomonadota bacterium]